MGGTLRGQLDCYANTNDRNSNTHIIFKVLYDFLKSHPNMTEIARNGGSGGTAANTGDFDGATPFLQNAWYVFRMNDATLESGAANPTGYSGPRTYPWYIYVQMLKVNLGTAINAAPAAPSASDAVTSVSYPQVMIQFAVPVGTVAGTSEVAWNGGGTMGTNTKGTPVWKSTAGTPTGFQGCYVSPRSNNIGGAHATNRENCNPIFPTPLIIDYPIRFNIIADDDMLIILCNVYDDNNVWYMNYFGLYTPRPGLTPTVPMVHVNGTIPLANANNLYGTIAGTIPSGGGIFMNNLAVDGVRSMCFSRYNEFFTQYAQPNKWFSAEQYDEFPIPLLLNEPGSYSAGGVNYMGYAGEITAIRETYGIPGGDSDNSKTTMVFGTGNISANLKIVVPWNGITVPRTNFFVRSGTTW